MKIVLALGAHLEGEVKVGENQVRFPHLSHLILEFSKKVLKI